ncbi:P-loop containing nucleoside triphosphate hydrolase protein [Obba rivulosa]|uniref:Guanine nucleotide-binding protein-like 1 n=1 Tax=Obba rivulosa TaxID=1052685 RepID=A0A8E2DS63_9APHY|nr:P-loop containing nucleoside triphosphate hydrolase protein [Obba rivulosa]
MHRRKPQSPKQKKAKLQLKRAVKRGDVSPPPPYRPERGQGKRGHAGQLGGSSRDAASADSSSRLQSSFVKVPPEFLQHTRQLASTLPLTRPIPPEVAILADLGEPAQINEDGPQRPTLTCPKRPKWRYDMSKKEVEMNEEGLFKKWLSQTDVEVNARYSQPVAQPSPEDGQVAKAEEQISMPHAPTSYERNLEVWRQLWRVTEISQILLILLDSRCPTLHLPSSLSSYLSSSPRLVDRTRTILVLTKVDICGPERAAAWTRFLHVKFPGLRVVQVESYIEKPISSTGGRKAYEPHLPSAFRQTLVKALQEAHAELLEPPASVKDDAERRARWVPPVRRQVDWTAVLDAHGGQVGTAVGGAIAPRPRIHDDEQGGPEEGETEGEPEFLTIGLIGQPNVGKSSLLNALFELPKVKASRTPGKTKHFQTLFWTPEVRLVDCPGLVMPSLVPMELQVLSGILPISRVSAVPLCIHYAAQLLPLERMYGLSHSALSASPVEDKRTWRVGTRPKEAGSPSKTPQWTAMDILTAYAEKKCWVTAQAGRPDVNRAGNAILRALAEGRVRWAFWPPGTPLEVVSAHQEDGCGIWIAQDIDEADTDSDEEPDTLHEPESETEGSVHGDDDESDEDKDEYAVKPSASRFSALSLDDTGVESPWEDEV